MSVPADPPPVLARFPAEVRDAYRRFQTEGDADAVHTVVQAALLDFLPRDKTEFPQCGVAAEDRLMDDLGYDSLAIAELIFFFEDLFKMTISAQEIRTVGTVAELHTFVASKLAPDRPLV